MFGFKGRRDRDLSRTDKDSPIPRVPVPPERDLERRGALLQLQQSQAGRVAATERGPRPWLTAGGTSQRDARLLNEDPLEHDPLLRWLLGLVFRARVVPQCYTEDDQRVKSRSPLPETLQVGGT